MKLKLNIIEPWEYGTEHAIDATIVQENNSDFLLFINPPRQIEQDTVQYFVCTFRNSEDKIALKGHLQGVYPIQMVFDKSIKSNTDKIHSIKDYRSNFLSGELVINIG